MPAFSQLILTALLAVTAENLLFAGGAGFSRALRAARKPSTAGLYALLVTLFSLVSALTGLALEPCLSLLGEEWILRPAVLTAAAGLEYLLAAGLLRVFAPSFLRDHGRILEQAAANTVVLAIPYVQQMFGFHALQALGYALGTGAAFWLAVLILSHAMKICTNPDAPKAFSGLPGVLVYVGILSMAFAGFTGGKVF
ncbi:MAG: hypothetical protein LKJ45_01750 [Oscillospiraceae bacterium]|jgi:electron transport complex protein RnfA|nr:hypothetical protein [Oscillospiraceae bacterium]